MLRRNLLSSHTGSLRGRNPLSLKLESVTTRGLGAWGPLLLCWIALSAVPAGAASDGGTDDLQGLRKEVQALKAGQKDIQKTLQTLKDILMGKAPLEDIFLSIEGAPTVGDKNAKVTMVEFSDYQCPFCGRYATQTLSQVLDEYVKTGKVRYVFRNFPLEQIHPLAEKAAEASACAGDQGKYWEAHDRFFKNQQALDAKEMPGHALALGLDAAEFQQCLDSGKYAARVRADLAEGQKYNVRGTPTFFFGTEVKGSKLKAVKSLSGAVPFQNFKDVIDGLLNPQDQEDSVDQ